MDNIPRIISVQLSFSIKFEKFLELSASTSMFLFPFLLHFFLSLFMPSLSLLLFASPLRLSRGIKGTFSLFHSYALFLKFLCSFTPHRSVYSFYSPSFFTLVHFTHSLAPGCFSFDSDERFPAFRTSHPASSKFRYCQYHKSARCAPAKIDDTHHWE